MIDINKLRRLVQAATPGPWYVTGKLTRYVEARIDGGLIQEVAACGPTKADGGYGPQQEANAHLIAAANPTAIAELLDRLEAAEKERDALRSKLEAVEKELEVERMRLAACGVAALGYFNGCAKEYESASLYDVMELRAKNDALRAKVEAMEKQEPVATIHINSITGNPSVDFIPGHRYLHHNSSLYALPGAKGEEK